MINRFTRITGVHGTFTLTDGVDVNGLQYIIIEEAYPEGVKPSEYDNACIVIDGEMLKAICTWYNEPKQQIGFTPGGKYRLRLGRSPGKYRPSKRFTKT